MNLSIPCAVLGGRYDVDYIENLLAPTGVDDNGDAVDDDSTGYGGASTAGVVPVNLIEVSAQIERLLSIWLSKVPSARYTISDVFALAILVLIYGPINFIYTLINDSRPSLDSLPKYFIFDP